MRIAVDAWELGPKPTGVGRYLAALIDEWACLEPAAPHRFVLFGPSGWPREPGDAGARDPRPWGWARFDHRSSRFESHEVGNAAGGRTRWEQWTLPRALASHGCDVLFAPAYSAPLWISAPTVLTVHDVSFAAHPEWFRPRERWRRVWLTRLSARRAHTVVTVSQQSASDIVRHLGVDPARVVVIPSGVPRLGTRGTPATPPPPVRPRSARDPLVLYVGSIFNRRRVPDLIRAFARVASARPDARLDIVGENRTHPTEDLSALAERCGLARLSRLRAYVSDDELAALYGQARAFVFLSEFEGFGFTPLEALAHGVPAVVADTPVAREIYGDAVLYVPVGDVEAAASAIGRLLDDNALHDTLVARAAEVLARYRWPLAASRTLHVLEEAARSPRRPTR